MTELQQLAGSLQKWGGLTIAVAESSTGGLFSEVLTSVPGASACFRLGVVGYGNDAKVKSIGVPKKLFKKYGAVSEPVAIAMAHHIRKRDGADIGVSITGINGPDGGSDAKPIGTCYLAVSFLRGDRKKRETVTVHKLEPVGFPSLDRESIRSHAVKEAMRLVIDLLQNDPEVCKLEKPVRQYRKYLTASPVVSVLRYFLPWKGDQFGDVFFKLLLLATITAAAITATQLMETTVIDFQQQKVLEQAVDALEKEPEAEAVSNLPEGYLDKYAGLYQINSEVAGWITIPDTNINLPVVQTDNNDFYLKHNFAKERDQNGVPFVDFRNRLKPEEFSTNTLVYGHNMTNGNIFRDLIYYKDVEYYKAHPIVQFDTVYEESQWKIISCFEANTETRFGEVFQYFNFVNTTKPDRIQKYIDDVTSMSYFLTDVDVNIDDEFLTLQTCANDAVETKICVVARKLREGESAEVNVDGATENANRVKPVRY